MSERVLTSEQRYARLDYRVADLTREARATVRYRGEFEVVLVRGSVVDHRRHFLGLGLAVLAGLGSAILKGTFLSDGGPLRPDRWMLLLALAVPSLYALFWFFIAVTGGEEFERISVDEQGVVTGARFGRPLETQANALKIGVPLLMLIAGCWVAVGLVHDMADPPMPTCAFPVSKPTDQCIELPVVGSRGVTFPDTGFTVAEYQGIERNVRALQLVWASMVIVPASWFLWRMLTGRWVVGVRPVRRNPARDPEGVSWPEPVRSLQS